MRDTQNESVESGPCDRCHSHSNSLTAITTIVNGIEQKEWVCPECEPDAREDEKPARHEIRTDGGQSRSSKPEHSNLWEKLKGDVESAGKDWDEFRKGNLESSLSVNQLKMAAAELGLCTAGACEDIASRLADEGCFFGPIGDDTVYQEKDGEAAIVIRRRRIWGHGKYLRRSDVEQ